MLQSERDQPGFVNGLSDVAAQIAEYPRDIAAYNNLGIVFAQQGLYEKAVEITRQGIGLEPSQVTLDENLTGYLQALQRFDEARKIIREKQNQKPDNYIFFAALYALAFISSDSKGMTEQRLCHPEKSRDSNALHCRVVRSLQSGLSRKNREIRAPFGYFGAKIGGVSLQSRLRGGACSLALTSLRAKFPCACRKSQTGICETLPLNKKPDIRGSVGKKFE